MKRSGRMAVVGLVASLVLIWGASLLVVRGSREPALIDAKHANAEQVVFYRMLPGDAVRLRLPAGPDTVRITTHLVVPKDLPYSAERQFVYGLNVALIGEDGERVLESSLFTRTRQSKAELKDGVWEKESAFTLEDDSLGDPREFTIPLPTNAPRPKFLEVRPAGDGSTVLVRAYGRSRAFKPLSSSEPEPPKRIHEKLEAATYIPFEKLHPATQRKLAEERWERLGAEGEAGVDYRPVRVYRTDFRIPITEVAETDRERLGTAAAVAMNVVGPADLVLRVWREPTASDVAGELAVGLLGQTGSRIDFKIPRPRGIQVAAHPLHVPEGLHTVTLRNGKEGDVRFLLEGPSDAWLAPPYVKGSATGTTALLPHVVKADAYVAGPGCSELELELDVKDPRRAPALRLDARLLRPTSSEDRGELQIALFDERGRRVDAGKLPVFGEVEAYETVELGHRVSSDLPCSEKTAEAITSGMAVTDKDVRTSEAVTSRLVLPRGTRKVRLSATRPIAVQLSSLLVAERGARPESPYDLQELEDVRWHFAPLDARSWHPMRPMNHAQLAAQGAEVAVRMQVRLEPDGNVHRPPPKGDAVSILPANLPVSQDLLETDPTPELATAQRDFLTVVTPGQPVKVKFDARAATRPELRLGLDDAAALGQPFELEIDGTPVLKSVLRSTRARELLPPIEPGEHVITIRSSAPGLRAVINRPPVEGEGDALQKRRVYRMTERGLRIPVVKKGKRAVMLNVVLYGTERDTAEQLRVVIDDGSPSRRAGVFVPRLTPGIRTFDLPKSVRPHAFAHGKPDTHLFPRRIAVRLGEDLSPGQHWVTVKPEKGSPLWARFFIYGDDAPEEPQEWTRPGWQEDEL